MIGLHITSWTKDSKEDMLIELYLSRLMRTTFLGLKYMLMTLYLELPLMLEL